MCLADTCITHQPQHLMEDSRSKRTTYEPREVTHRRLVDDEHLRVTAEEIIETGHSSSFNASVNSDVTGARSLGKCAVNENLVEKINRGSGGSNMKLESFPQRKKMVPAPSFTSVVEFHDAIDSRRSVTWVSPSVVTDVHYRPQCTLAERQALFYTEDDTRRFRNNAKLASKINRIKQQQATSTTSSQYDTDSTDSPNLTSPISSLVNIATDYISRLLTSMERSPTSRSSNSTIPESTNTLVETLYLF